MIINELVLKNFGKFQNRKILLKEGINIIYGENESGKTTIHTFLQSIFFGMKRMRGKASRTDTYSRYTPWENPGWYEGAVTFTCGNKRFRLERNFGKPSEEAVLFCETDGELLSVADGDLEMLLGNISESVYRNTISVGQMKSRTEDGLLTELRDCLGDFQGFGEQKLNPEKALDILKEKRKIWEKKEKDVLLKKQKAAEELRYRIGYEKEETASLSGKIKELNAGKIPKENVPAGENKNYVFYVAALASVCVGIVFLITSRVFVGSGIILEGLAAAVLGIRVNRKTAKKQSAEKALEEKSVQKTAEQKKILETSLKEREVRIYNLTEELQELEADNRKILEIRQEIRAIETAGNMIKEVSGKMQGTAAKVLKDRMSRMFKSMTGGRYSRVMLDEELHVSLDDGERCLGLHQVSHGTVEQVYLALRMACGEILCQDEELPVILDETFAMYDDNRLLQTLKWLGRTKSQIILFSCNKREIEVLEKGNIEYHVIRL